MYVCYRNKLFAHHKNHQILSVITQDKQSYRIPTAEIKWFVPLTNLSCSNGKFTVFIITSLKELFGYKFSTNWQPLVCIQFQFTEYRLISGFMNFVVMPLFKEWHEYHQSSLSQTILSNIKLNKENWEDILLQSKIDEVCT